MKRTNTNSSVAAVIAAIMMMAASNTFATGTSAAQFLKLSVGARATGMANAFSSVADDVTATYWNPAGLAQLESTEIGAMQNSHFDNTNFQYIGAVSPMAGFVLGASVYRLDYGTIDRYTASDTKDGSFNAGSLAGSISAAKKIQDNLLVGANLKYVSESIESEKASTFAADLGILYKRNNMNFSGVVQHLGPSMKLVKDSSPLPATVRLGASTHVLNERLLVALEASKPNDANVSLHLGAEYHLTPAFAVRGGYEATPGQSADLGGLAGLNAGLGMQLNRFNLDYSVSPFGDLGLSHRISIGYKLGSSSTN